MFGYEIQLNLGNNNLVLVVKNVSIINILK